MTDERWRWVVGYEGLYMVSDQGRVMSVPKATKPDGVVLSQQLGKNGYLTVHLCKNGKHRRVSVHRIVASAFIENPHGKSDVNHKNGDKQNNALNNLEWVTRSENVKHAYDTLKRTRSHIGTPRPTKRKLTYEQAEEIRASNESQSNLAKEYGVTQRSIWCIKKGMTYKEAM